MILMTLILRRSKPVCSGVLTKILEGEVTSLNLMGPVSILSVHGQDSPETTVLTLGDPSTSKAELSDQESTKESTQNAVLSVFQPWLSC